MEEVEDNEIEMKSDDEEFEDEDGKKEIIKKKKSKKDKKEKKDKKDKKSKKSKKDKEKLKD